MRDWGRSDDDQRHRLVINGTVNTSMAPAATAWEHLSHGFQLSGMLQYYSALPFNITSGVANLQGSTSRPLANGATAPANFDVRAVTFIPRNGGVGSDFFTLNLRVSRAFRINADMKVEGLVEAFNVTNRANNLTRNANFGSGAYPTNPLADVQSDHGSRRSSHVPARRAFHVLRRPCTRFQTCRLRVLSPATPRGTSPSRGTPGPDDSMTFVPMEAPVGTAGSYPAIAATATGVVAVWTKPAESGSRIAFATVTGHR